MRADTQLFPLPEWGRGARSETRGGECSRIRPSPTAPQLVILKVILMT